MHCCGWIAHGISGGMLQTNQTRSGRLTLARQESMDVGLGKSHPSTVQVQVQAQAQAQAQEALSNNEICITMAYC